MFSLIDPVHIKSPGQVLFEKYLKPQGISARRFSSLSGIWPGRVNNVIKGAFMSHYVIHRVSMVTKTAPRYWYHLQANYEFHKYLSSRKNAPKIEPIRFEIKSHLFESPGQVLEREFIKPTGKSYHALAKGMNVHWLTLPDIVNKRRRITPLMAHKLAKAFDTETKYWLDLQSCYEIQQLLEENPVSEKRIAKSLSIFSGLVAPRRHRFKNRSFPINPGKIVKLKFLKPSRIRILDWHKVLSIPWREFKAILSGKTEISSQHLLKLARVFNRDIGYWIEIHNGYYAQRVDARFYKASRQIAKVDSQVPFQNAAQRIPPLKFLIENFLKPMQITQLHFLRHVKLNADNFGNIIQRRISHETAIRIGEALEMDPMYWVSMQLEYDIEKYGKGERPYRLWPSHHLS